MTSFSLTRLSSNWASKNLRTGLQLVVLFIIEKLDRAFVNLICNLTPGSKYVGTLSRLLCNRANSWTSLLALSLFPPVMNPRFVVTVRVSAVGSQGCMSPVSIYQCAFEKFEGAASVP